MIASLPWYELPETAPHWDTFWRRVSASLRGAGVARAPRQLTRDVDHRSVVARPDLLLGQTCGPVVGARWSDPSPELRVVAAPCFEADGCEGSLYRSLVVVSPECPARSIEELRGTRCVANEPASHSGAGALRRLVLPLQRDGHFFSSVRWSGSHVASVQALACGDADIAAIDCVIWALLRRHRPGLLERLRVLAWTEPAPAPPFVTAAANPPAVVAALRAALREAVKEDAARKDLLLHMLENRSTDDYAPLREEAAHARERGYAELG